MATQQQMVVGIFDDNSQAEQAINDLQNAGFSNDQIRYSGHGAEAGGFLASLKSFFTGTETGRVYDDLADLGVSHEDASYYQREYEAGHSIVAVLAGGRTDEAMSILQKYGGYSQNRGYEQTSDYAATQSTDRPQTDTEGEQRLKLREEQLNVQKQPVETGEARLRKDVVSEQQSVDVPVTHEEVYVERRRGTGQPSDTPIGEGETYRVPVRDEQVTASKQTVETGEVAMGKKQFQETKRVSDTVQREEAHIERSGDANVQGSDVEDTDQTTP